jgi:hypothetical protein
MIAYALWAEGPASQPDSARDLSLFVSQLHQSYAERSQILANAAKPFICKGF